MKTGYLILIFALLIPDPVKIGKINRVKEEARKAYLAGDYETAAGRYTYLIDSLQVTEDEVSLNLANAYFQLSDTANAISNYQTLTQSQKNSIRSTAQQQLGVIKNKQGKFEEALTHFKEAIKSDPSNNDARYNYELLKRKLDEQKKQEQKQKDNKDQDQQKKDQQKDQEKKEEQKKDQEKKEQDQKSDPNKPDEKKDDQQKDQQKEQQPDQKEDKEKKENKPSSQKLEEMKISEEKAKMILEAMKNQEIQYLQQNKRKATKPKDKTKPDW